MIITLSFMLGFAIGLLLPRDIAPLRRLSAHFMRNHDNRNMAWIVTLAAACALVVILLLAGCGRREAQLSTGQTIGAIALPTALKAGHWAGDTAYAVVRRAALPEIYADFRATLSDLGLVKWDARFDCNRFATLYIGVAQARYAAAAWHSSTPAQALALAEVWYSPGGKPDKGHAIVLAVTETGPVYIEPQTGREISLTPAEERSLLLAKW